MNTTSSNDNNPVIRFETPSDIVPLMKEFTQKGIRHLDIFSHDLCPSLYENQTVLDAIIGLTTYSSRSKIRILVKNTKHLIQTGCPLIAFARRMPSKISVRLYAEGVKDPDIGFYCIDKKHLIFFNNERLHQGFARFNAKPESKKALDEFEHLWVYGSKEDPNLRQLCI